jgi:hypothetical protein
MSMGIEEHNSRVYPEAIPAISYPYQSGRRLQVKYRVYIYIPGLGRARCGFPVLGGYLTVIITAGSSFFGEKQG